MAIDTAEKRASVGGIGPLALSFPVPDTAINAGDREQVAALYRGITDGAPPPPGGSIFLRPGKVQWPG